MSMSLNKFANELVAKNIFVKCSFGGFQGSGKTRTATEFIIGAYKDMGCTKPILCLDNEKGSRFLIPLFKKHGIKILVKDTAALADVHQAFDYLSKGEIDFLFIDSLTKIYYQFVKDYKQKNRRSFMGLQDWGKLLPAWQEEFSDRFVNTEGNIIFTGRGGFEYEKEDNVLDDEGHILEKGSFVKSGFKMKIAGETPYETDLNVWMQLEKSLENGKPKQQNIAYILKDRSDLINGRSFTMPSYSDFKCLIDFLKDLPKGEVSKETYKTNLAPSEDYGYYERNLKRKIELEKIQSVFDKNGLGSVQAKADKQLKANIIEKVFGTTSQTEIDKMDHSELSMRRNLLEDLFKQLVSQEYKLEFVQSYVLPLSQVA